MEIELNKLVEGFANSDFKVQGVYYNKVEPRKSGFQKTASFPGFIFPIKGQAKYHFNGTPYTAESGNIIHGGANMNLDKQVLGDNSWEFISILYNINSFENGDLNLQDIHFELKIGQNPKLINLLSRLQNISKEDYAMSKFQTENIFRSILEEIFISAKDQQKYGTQALFTRVSYYIQNNYMNTMTVKELAEKHGVSENHLFYVFNKHVNIGPIEYIKEYRLNHVKNLLITSDASIAEVAESVGYLDPLYFSRIFKGKFGVSPSMFRKIQE